MGGGCSVPESSRETATSTPAFVKFGRRKSSYLRTEHLQSSLPYFISTSDELLKYKTSDLYSTNQTMVTHFSSDDETYSRQIMENHFSPAGDETYCTTASNDRNTSNMVTRREKVLPNERTSESSVTITVDENSTLLPDSLEECSLASVSQTNIINNQSQNAGSKVTSLPSEILNQFWKLANTDNPETKAVVQQLLNYLAKLPKSEKNKACWEVDLICRSLDLDISLNQNNVNIPSELVSDRDHFAWTLDGENELTLSGLESWLGDAMVGMLQNGEKTKGNDFDIFEFSKQQVIDTHNKSILMTEALDNMPSLTQSISGKQTDKTKDLSIEDGFLMSKDMNWETITTEIDELDKKITESKQKLTHFRRRSLDLLLKNEDDSGDSTEEGKNLSLFLVEQEIQRCQNHKSKLENERYKIITHLNSRLTGNLEADKVLCDRRDTDSLSESPTTTIKRCPSEVNAIPILGE